MNEIVDSIEIYRGLDKLMVTRFVGAVNHIGTFEKGVIINTPDGIQLCYIGDYIDKDSKGNFYKRKG